MSGGDVRKATIKLRREVDDLLDVLGRERLSLRAKRAYHRLVAAEQELDAIDPYDEET